MRNSIIIAFILLMLCSGNTFAQLKSNHHSKKIAVIDSVLIDTLSILPNSVKIFQNNILLDTSAYQLDYTKALLTWKNKPSKDSVEITYRTFPVLLNKRYFHKNPSLISPEIVSNNPYVYQVKQEENTLFSFEGIEKSGSISRSIGFGNSQDLSVNSNMVLQFSGKLNNEIEFTAAISDDNIPIQPDGNTQQINDFDKVFIQLKRKNSVLIAGDYELRKPDSYFMNYFKRTQGAYVSHSFKDKKGFEYSTQAAGAVAKGRSARNLFDGEEGNQGPYRLGGNNGEQYIIVLSGTERVFIDGELLLRGQENDYVMDYNTSEITFTSKRLITRYSRIVVEFEYSDKIYGRSLYFVSQDFKSEKLKIGFNLFSEQDNPNRPILQTLSDEQQDFLKGIGNDINNAVYPNVDSVAFNSNEILYKRIDTLGNANVYVYSTNPDSAKYRTGFSYVGPGKGNYTLDVSSAANGRVYKFIAPIGGIPQGDYEPVTLIITPKRQQLLTLNADYKIAKNSSLFTEVGMSNNDVNLFSTIGNDQNQGFAYKMIYKQQNLLSGNDSTGLKLNTQISYEYTDKQFTPLERYRPVEFDRDFNFRGLSLQPSQEHWSNISLSLHQSQQKEISYKISSLIRTEYYSGLQQELAAKYRYKTYRFNYSGSLLHTKADSLNGDFLKQRVLLAKEFKKKIELGTEFQQEQNKTYNTSNNLLNLQSFAFKQFDYFVRSTSQLQNTAFQLNYIQRMDDMPILNSLEAYSKASTYNAKFEFNRKGKSPLNINATYRTISYLQDSSTNQNEETLLSRIEYNLNTLKGFVNLNSFYELGTGQEPKREFIYLEVPAGQGLYAWNDYNNNGVKELNEFEISRFPDQAKYIRIFRPTNEFIRSNFTNINQTLRLTPATIIRQKTGFLGLLSRLSTITVLRIDKKVLAGDGDLLLNPYQTHVDAANLVSLNSFLRNTIFFNRNNPRWGIDFNTQKSGNKSLLTNGFDSRDTEEQSLRFKWNFVRKSNFMLDLKTGNKQYSSELFTEKNYRISFKELQPEFGYQFNTDFKVTLNAGLRQQKNKEEFGGEASLNAKLGTEIRYNILKKGSFTFQMNFINNKFEGDNNTAIAYELLDGLQPGSNVTWSAGIQRSVSNGVQLNFTYEGRKSSSVKTIHTGGLQVRAYF